MITIQKTDLEFDPPLPAFIEMRSKFPLTVVSGANNSGKSLLLKWIKAHMGTHSYMVGTSRFYHIYHLSTELRNRDQELIDWENQFRHNFWQEQFNHEQNYIDLNRILMGLTDKKRDVLFQLCSELIGARFSLKKVEEDNELSVRYIDMDGQNLSVGSTGTRLLMTMLGICMDERFDTLLIDEPELGLSPRVQQALATFLQDVHLRQSYFPHLSRVFLATHSHIFLHRGDIQSNFIVAKAGKHISVQQLQSVSDLHRLQFNLLGNSLESMFFPSAVILVEGKTDFRFLERVLQVKFPDRRITIVQANGDSEIKRRVHMLKEMLGDLSRSPFRSRLFVVLDETHGSGLMSDLVSLGVEQENIVVWSKNGIEFYYPPAVLGSIFACDPERLPDISITGDIIEVNGIRRTKSQLAEEVASRLDSDSIFPEEFVKKLLEPIDKAVR